MLFRSGAITKKRFIQNLEHPQPKTYVGKGKLEEIKAYVEKNKIDLVIFDDELTPAQVRNIETEIENTKILSRTHLILDIFANNAKTAQAKTQVELAQYQYLLPRLKGMWKHLERQGGGKPDIAKIKTTGMNKSDLVRQEDSNIVIDIPGLEPLTIHSVKFHSNMLSSDKQSLKIKTR